MSCMGSGIINKINKLAEGIYLCPDHWAQMEAEVRTRAPEEACGIVAGEGNHSRMVIPITNILHSPFRFRMEPEEQLNAFLLVEENKWEIVAVYHSHPQGIDAPSPTDYKELTYPGIIYLIWYKRTIEWLCRGYLMIGQTKANEVPVLILAE